MPLPAKVRGNNWTAVDVAPLESFEPRLHATVVVPYYQAPDALTLTLAGLERQTYPQALFEVIVVDDGSDPPLELSEPSPLEVRVVHQPDLGFGLARARNNGVAAAQGDIVVFLDCDMIPEDEWLAAHARWHHAASDAMSIGFRRHVDVEGISADDVRSRCGTLEELFEDRPSKRPEWIEFHMARTADLTSSDDDLFRVASGGNLGMSRRFYLEAGGNDESFNQWGAEDVEFGYRAFTRGALLVPERRARCWHQGEGAAPSEAEARNLEQQQAKLSQLVAHDGFRSDKPGRSFAVPQYVVSVATAGTGTDTQLETVERLLAGDVHDLVVWVEQHPPSGEDEDHASEILRRLLQGDPRVHLGPAGGALSAFAASQFHIFVQAGAPVSSDLVSRLRKRLVPDADHVTATEGDGTVAVLVRARRLHRELRAGLDLATITAASLTERLDGRALRQPIGGRGLQGAASAPTGPGRDYPEGTPTVISAPARATTSGRMPRLRKLWRIAAYTVAEACAVRSWRDARRLARTVGAWVARAVSWRVRWIAWQGRKTARWARRKASHLAKTLPRRRRRVTPIRPATYRLGPSIAAHGSRSTAVFAAWARLRTDPAVPADIVLCDQGSPPTGLAPRPGGAVVSLGQMAPTAATPAFDAEQVNPAGWPEAWKPAAALGTPNQLPTRRASFRRVSAANLEKARSCHHVDDVAAYHHHPQSRAGRLAALAAAGAVVHLRDGGGEVAALLGERLHALMTDGGIATASRAEREALSVDMRREALRTHSLRARARQVCEAASADVSLLPLVSVLLATRRPDRVVEAVASVASQTYPRVELVLAAHGDGFDRDLIETTVAGCGIEARVVTVPSARVLGEVLNEATELSRGALVTKFDDDDFYGPEHLWDLVLAHEYSKASLVGKAAEYVYLEGADRTLRRFRGGAEQVGSRLTLAGGAMLISRRDLDAVMGWQPVPSGVDKALIEDVASSGRLLYRTHGRGFVLVRHARGHTWQVDDQYFLKQAVEVREGCDLDFAGASPPPTMPDAAAARPRPVEGTAPAAQAGAGERRAGLAGAEPAEQASYSLGAEIATRGDRAAAVFAASARVGRRLHDSTDVVLTDTPETLTGLPPATLAISLSRLPPSASVPAFDPEQHNPIGWGPAIDPGHTAGEGERTGPAGLRRAHHVEDWTTGQSDPAARAGELVAAAATGAVVCIREHDPGLESCLGTELYGLMTALAPIASAGSHQREMLSIAMRRAALRDHSLRARARQVLACAGLEGPGLPLVSVLAPTNRPERLADVIMAVDAQTYPRIELVTALHGDGFEPDRAEGRLEQLRFPARALRVSSDHSLGDVLNAALEASTGTMIAKFDDDDLYSPQHLWDMVLAAEYSGADVVSKTSEYVYLASVDRTVRRFTGLGERYIDPMRHSIAGPAMLVARHALERIGGWRPMGVGEDKVLAQDLGAAGSRVYRTHGAGFLLVRHGTGHTWDVEDSYFLEQAQDGRDGCDLRFAGIA